MNIPTDEVVLLILKADINSIIVSQVTERNENTIFLKKPLMFITQTTMEGTLTGGFMEWIPSEFLNDSIIPIGNSDILFEKEASDEVCHMYAQSLMVSAMRNQMLKQKKMTAEQKESTSDNTKEPLVPPLPDEPTEKALDDVKDLIKEIKYLAESNKATKH